MNYFAHGHAYISRPWFLAGTALPDWLGVVDRRIRLRSKVLGPLVEQREFGESSPERELAEGVLQHLRDDAWFHETAAFFQVTGGVAKLFRELLDGSDDHRPGFLGHLATELLLDSHLIAADPARLEAYYAAVDRIDPAVVARFVGRFTPHPVENVTEWIPLFTRERFLADYLDSARLLVRLNQVLRRVKLPGLPADSIACLDAARRMVSESADQLLAAPVGTRG
jgi:hypothetical protein